MMDWAGGTREQELRYQERDRHAASAGSAPHKPFARVDGGRLPLPFMGSCGDGGDRLHGAEPPGRGEGPGERPGEADPGRTDAAEAPTASTPVARRLTWAWKPAPAQPIVDARVLQDVEQTGTTTLALAGAPGRQCRGQESLNPRSEADRGCRRSSGLPLPADAGAAAGGWRGRTLGAETRSQILNWFVTRDLQTSVCCNLSRF